MGICRDLQALVGSDGPRLVGRGLQLWLAAMGLVLSMGICKVWLAVMGLVWWEPCLWGFAALVGSSGPRLVGAVSMGMCKLWLAVLGLVWWEPCLWGFASFGRQFGGLQLWLAVLGLVWEPCLWGFASFGRQ